MDAIQVRTSRFFSLILRHKLEEAGVSLDESGWCNIQDLLKGCALHGYKISREELNEIVADNDKKRFQISNDGKRIRAVQGHSVKVDLKYVPIQPPDLLYHGTATRFLDSIREKGLLRGSRQYVHLSSNADTARNVGARHGKTVVIPIDAKSMYLNGSNFYLAPNGVWLVYTVPPQYLKFHDLLY